MKKIKEPWKYYGFLIVVLNLTIASAHWIRMTAKEELRVNLSAKATWELEMIILASLLPCFVHILIVLWHCLVKQGRFLELKKGQYWRIGIIQSIAVLLGLTVGFRWYAGGLIVFCMYVGILAAGERYIVREKNI